MVDLTEGTAAARGFNLLRALAARDGSDGFYTAMLIAGLLRGEEEGWALGNYPGASVYLAPDVAPPEWLDLLAAASGARLLPAMNEADRRAEIASPFDRRRGTNAAIVEVTKRYLTGDDPYVQLLERHNPDSPADDAPDDLTIITKTSETPADTTALHLAWEERTVPIDVTVHHIVSDAPIIDQGSRTIDSVSAAIDDATLSDIT